MRNDEEMTVEQDDLVKAQNAGFVVLVFCLLAVVLLVAEILQHLGCMTPYK